MSGADADKLWAVATVLAREAARVSRAAGRRPPNLPPLLYFTDGERTPRPWDIVARLPPGVGVVYRHFGAEDRLETAQRLREASAQGDVLMLVGADEALAEAVEADGLHLPQRALGDATGVRERHPGWRVTAAWHDETTALVDGVDLQVLDAITLSPVFATSGPSRERSALGIQSLSMFASRCPVPVYALGGIDANNADMLLDTGVCGLAGVGSIHSAWNIG